MGQMFEKSLIRHISESYAFFTRLDFSSCAESSETALSNVLGIGLSFS